jgi:methionine salvage enolase-phosphatase E1
MKYNFLNNPTFDSSKIKDFTKFLFVFDGAYAYSPKRFNAYLKSNNEKSPISSKVTKVIDAEKRRVSYTPVLDMLFTSELKDSHLIFYFAQTSIKDAKRLTAQIQKAHNSY